MSILNVEHLTHGFGDRAILDDVSFRLLKGEHIGLVGANGEGKSTFLNIVTGKLMPDEGKVEWAKNVRVGYLDQHSTLTAGMTIESVLKSAFSWLFALEEKMNQICDALGEADESQMDAMMEELGVIQDTLTMHDFYTIDAKVEEVARALGLLELGLHHDVTDLSGGQRMKVLLAKLLLEKPDILLLDEPTNYLDAEHIAWLTRYLQEYENAFILISHDIPFLNDVVNIIYHMENQHLDRYVGNYDKFEEVYAVKKAQLEAAYRKQQQEISELKDFVARNKARVSTRNMAMSRQKKLDKMDVIELAAERPKPEFSFPVGRTPGRYIFETKELVIGYEEPLSKPLSIALERGHKVALIGANGIGKTTLLKSLLGLIPALGGGVEQGENLMIGYFEQEIKGENKRTCIEEIWEEFPAFSQYEVRAALARCGLTTKHIESQVRVLSGGEQAKVRLCKLMNRETNVLLLDEPTNHLDIESIRWLETFLMNYKGAVLIVSHDRYFLDRVVSKVVEIFQHKGYVYQGNYSDYAKKKAAIRAAMIKQYYNQQREIRHQEEVIAKLKSFNREKSIKRAESREKLLDKIERIEKPTEDNTDIRIVLEPNVVSGNDVLKVEGLAKAFPPLQLFSGINFEVKRGERVALIGNNGTGKTTILKIINELIPPDAGTVTLGSNVHIGYYDQEHQQLHMEKTIFDEIADDYPNLNNTKVRNVLAAFLFTDDDVYKRIEDLSGGERGRVALAKLMLSDANFLILDEPTNHLDITSKEILEEALKSYTGTVFFVSHDRYFINQTATRILELTGETVVNYIGNYDYYLEKHDQMVALYVKKPEDEAQTEASVKETAQKVDWQTQKAEQARIRKIENALKKAEEKIAELEEKIASIDAECAKPEVAVNSAKLGELTKQQSEYQEELEKQYEVWEELSMELDA